MSYAVDKQVIDTHMDTDRYTDAGDDNTRRPNWPRVKMVDWCQKLNYQY